MHLSDCVDYVLSESRQKLAGAEDACWKKQKWPDMLSLSIQNGMGTIRESTKGDKKPEAAFKTPEISHSSATDRCIHHPYNPELLQYADIDVTAAKGNTFLTDIMICAQRNLQAVLIS